MFVVGESAVLLSFTFTLSNSQIEVIVSFGGFYIKEISPLTCPYRLGIDFFTGTFAGVASLKIIVLHISLVSV